MQSPIGAVSIRDAVTVAGAPSGDFAASSRLGSMISLRSCSDAFGGAVASSHALTVRSMFTVVPLLAR